jgi:hypothetical protein
MRALHVTEELLAVVEALLTKLAQRMPLEPALRQRACLVALTVVTLKTGLGVEKLLTNKDLDCITECFNVLEMLIRIDVLQWNPAVHLKPTFLLFMHMSQKLIL